MNLDQIIVTPLEPPLENRQSPTFPFPSGDPETPTASAFEFQISPAAAVIQVGASYQFAVFKTKAGVVTDVTASCSFHSSSGILSVTVAGLASGASSSVTPVTLTATYAGQAAVASVRVTAACSGETAAFAFIFDRSLSMSRDFSVGVSKLATAKLVALDLNNVPDYPNDAVIVIDFVETAAGSVESAVKATVDTAIGAIIQSAGSSSIYNALAWAQFRLSLSVRTIKMAIIFTDGEEKLGPDSIQLATLMKSQGMVIAAVNVGGGAVGYANLMPLVTDFMLATGTLSQLKTQVESFPGFLCSGNVSYGNPPTTALLPPAGVAGSITGKVVIPAISTCGPTDVVFCIDISGLMANAIANLKANIGLILADLVAASPDYAIGVVTFGDNVRVLQTLTDGLENQTDTQTAIEALAVENTSRSPQSSDEALRTIIGSLGTANRTTGDTSDPVVEPIQVGPTFDGWRVATTKIVILITNGQPGGFTDENWQTDQDDMHSRALEAAAAGIRISTIYPHDLTVNGLTHTALVDLATTTGGLYAKMPATSAMLWAAIKEVVRTCGSGPIGSTSGAELLSLQSAAGGVVYGQLTNLKTVSPIITRKHAAKAVANFISEADQLSNVVFNLEQSDDCPPSWKEKLKRHRAHFDKAKFEMPIWLKS